MTETGVSALNAWDSFYVIIGSSSAALTGLMFVVVTLLPEARRKMQGTSEGISAFATPTVVHFCAALLVSSMLSAPWDALWKVGVAVSVTGAIGVVYCVIVTRRVHRQTDYRPVFEDWLWHSFLTFAAYGVLIIGGAVLRNDATDALFAMGGATLLLLFIGIHNAWDTVTYVALDQFQNGASKK